MLPPLPHGGSVFGENSFYRSDKQKQYTRSLVLYAQGALCGSVGTHKALIGVLCEGSSMRLYKASQ